MNNMLIPAVFQSGNVYYAHCTNNSGIISTYIIDCSNESPLLGTCFYSYAHCKTITHTYKSVKISFYEEPSCSVLYEYYSN